MIQFQNCYSGETIFSFPKNEKPQIEIPTTPSLCVHKPERERLLRRGQERKLRSLQPKQKIGNFVQREKFRISRQIEAAIK